MTCFWGVGTFFSIFAPELAYQSEGKLISVVNKLTLLLAFLLLVACNHKNEKQAKSIETPWGTVSKNVPDTMEQYTLKEILQNGELVALTISGEKTYYSYQNAELGVQYMVGAKLAEDLGVALRVEECRDTVEMVDKLLHGDGDVIMMPVRKDIVDSDSLVFCGPEEDDAQWAVLAYNKELADTIDKWFDPEILEEMEKKEDYILNINSVQCTASAPYVDKEKGIISEWDYLFKAYAENANTDWRLLAAICYQESCFDPNARSWAGACGLMQLMPKTALSLGMEEEDIFEPEANVSTAAQYLSQLAMFYRDVPDYGERMNFVLASYNGGMGHVRDAMALTKKNGGDPYLWEDVAEYILLLSKPQYYRDDVVKHGYMRGTETHNYVASVRERYEEYSGEKLGGAVDRSTTYTGVSTEPIRRVAKTNRFQI